MNSCSSSMMVRCSGFQGPALYKRLSQSFGYLNKQGYCTGSNTVGAPSGTCHVFPVILGEMGSGFAVRPSRCRWGAQM
jgi:hypothetical protein